jgi:hypothetical protein
MFISGTEFKNTNQIKCHQRRKRILMNICVYKKMKLM